VRGGRPPVFSPAGEDQAIQRRPDRIIERVRNGYPARGRCDALYIGQLDPEPTRRLFAEMRGKPVTTIAEDDPDCRSGAMFCLLSTARGLSFQLNLDAVSRSGRRENRRGS
jgi:hypothetical protein